MNVTEAELKAHSTAPRITPELLDENIVAINYLNVGDAILRTGQQPDHVSHHLLTLCILVLKNGFTITGQSACASPANFNKEIGERLALADAKRQVWPLMAYRLKEQLNAIHQVTSKQDASDALDYALTSLLAHSYGNVDALSIQGASVLVDFMASTGSIDMGDQ